jgi:pyruvyltransferase
MERLSRCRQVAASSLHGLIFADAYRVPDVWFVVAANPLKAFCLRATTFVHDNFKYHDYLASIDRDREEPIAVGWDAPWEEMEQRVANWKPIHWDPVPLLEAFPDKSRNWGQHVAPATAYYREFHPLQEKSGCWQH